MMVALKSIRRRFLNIIGTSNLEKTVAFIARGLGVNLLSLAYHQQGILKYWNNSVSGESYVIKSVLTSYLQNDRPIIFDVGANIGDYAEELKHIFPESRIYAFEPNSNTFKKLKEKINATDIQAFCVGLSSSASKQKVYTYASDDESQHASVYKEVLSDLHGATDILEIDFETISLDEFCIQQEIKKIDFLKIDTEGHELEVLSGAKRMISEGNIRIIQFEFNEMNVISRVFLKDFYHILVDYDIYRIDSNRLIPLFEYSSSNEIFQFQNFLAIRNSISKKA
jgi:FkbM family methyltransferase